MKLNNAFVLLFGILPLWPQYHSTAQGTIKTIEIVKDSLHIQAAKNVADSLISVNDSIAGTNLRIVNNLEKVANTLPEKLRDLNKDVQKLAEKKTDTVAMRVTKYIPVPETVDKRLYWQRQRYITDSIAKAKQDSIKWKNRGILRKIFGTGRRYMR